MWTNKSFILLTLVSVLSSSHINEDRFNYLNQQKPLWILNDQVTSKEHDSIWQNKIKTNDKPKYPNHFYLRHQSRTLFPFSESSPSPLDLPKDYIYARRYNFSHYDPRTRYTQQRSTRIQPIFIPISKQSYATSMPRYELDSDEDVLGPIFIFNGPKGELILNTMLGKQELSLPEPTPDQILNPPTAPLVHPKLIMQRYRVPGHEAPTNLTLIPFYEHEAIIPHFLSEETDKQTAVLYAAQAPTRSSTTTTTAKPTKKRRYKKAKHYTVYHSPDEVHWRPTEDALFRFSDATTPYPMVLASPLENHRYSVNPLEITTTLKPPKNFKLSYKDEDSQFRIVYVDESLESPVSREATPTGSPRSKPLPLLSSHYFAGKKYYAFPVYTLGKLLKADTAEQPKVIPADNSKRDDTWFILNSRYKGPHIRDGFQRLSSKYIEIPREAKARLLDESAETTLEQSILL